MNLRRLVNQLWKSSPKDWVERVRRRASGAPTGELERWVWCLSTGRAGTQTVAALANLADGVDGQHEPKPLLYGLSKRAYELSENESCRRVLEEAVRACRAQRPDSGARTYVETSPQVTFLAPILREVFPGSRFIHLVRSPAAVVRSAMRRNWYGGSRFDEWRITPASGPARERWDELSLLEKNAWLWAETNRWIGEFMEGLSEGEGVVLRSEELFDGQAEAVDMFFALLGAEAPAGKEIERVLGKRLNRQTAGEFPEMVDWTADEREALDRQAGELMKHYGYQLAGCE